MRNGKEQWCYWQSCCGDYVGFACGAQLADGVVFECPYTKDDIDPLHKLPRKKSQRPDAGADGVCRDYKPVT